jgi:oligopeptide transport system substrate-binding protein
MPDVAEDWQVTDGGRRYIFKLRQSFWSDGVAVTAHDFVYAFRRVLDPHTGSRYANFLYPIFNARAVNEGSMGVEALGVSALSNHELEIRLEKPVPYLLSILAFYTAMPVPRHLLERLAKRGIDVAHWTRPEHIVSNGPYLLKRWRFRRDILLEKNARYWDASAVKMKRVKLFMVDSYNTTLNLYKAGELDHIGQSSLPVAVCVPALAQREATAAR